MSEPISITIVLIGPHTAGKSTILQRLQELYCWTPHFELGDTLRQPDPVTDTLPDCMASANSFDEFILQAESQRDSEPKVRVRVVETWHVGNLGWAEGRSDSSFFYSLQQHTAAAVNDHRRSAAVLIQPLTCSADTAMLRRQNGAAARLPAVEGSDAELVEHSRLVSSLSLSHARALDLPILADISTDAIDIDTTAKRVYAQVLQALLPQPRFPLVKKWFSGCDEALAILRCALRLDSNLEPVVKAIEGVIGRVGGDEDKDKDKDEDEEAAGRSVVARLSKLVVLDGLDGVGKSTLLRSLGGSILGSRISVTPSASISAFLPLFHSQPSVVTRAYYMLSNYVAAVEIGSTNNHASTILDRYYHSTAAYTIGSAAASEEEVRRMSISMPELFRWPKDLPPPRLVLRLCMGDDARVVRLRARPAEWGANEEKQAADPTLAGRIAEAYARVECPAGTTVVNLDASVSQAELLGAALAECVKAGIVSISECAETPSQCCLKAYPDPLQELVIRSHRRGLCRLDGHRLSGTPWFMQIATAGATQDSPPSLRTVGLFHVCSHSHAGGLLFVSQGGPGGSRGRSVAAPAAGPAGSSDALAVVEAGGVPMSAVVLSGAPPLEEQWRFEGVAVRQAGVLPWAPQSLLASMLACADDQIEGPSTALYNSTVLKRAALDGDSVTEEELRRADIAAYRLVVTWGELMCGGPSTPGGPAKCAWRRQSPDDAWTWKKVLPFNNGCL